MRVRTGCTLIVFFLLAGAQVSSGKDKKDAAAEVSRSSGKTVIIRSDGSGTMQVVPSGTLNAGPGVDAKSLKRTHKGEAKPGEPPGAAKPGSSSSKSGPPGEQPPGADGKPAGDPSKSEPGPPAVIARPETPSAPADPDELKVRPDSDGLVHFQFRGQKWPDVLEWFADIAGVSVDWLELPGDYLNISTQRGYSVEDTRDLLNRLLLARGFTMLQNGEFVIVVKCDKLNSALVPRVTVEELDECRTHEFVRVLFPLDWVLASEAVKELDPLLSSNGKLFPLTATNRIEAMDAVGNLRDIKRLLIEEQTDQGDEKGLVREFVLHYARADEVRDQLTEFLGVEGSKSPSSSRGMSPQQMAQQQAMMRMQAQMQAQQAKMAKSSSRPSTMRGAAKERPVRLMVNRRRNSILAQAPPDKMATLEEAIRLLDVPSDKPNSLQSLLGRMQVYRLAQLDPENLVESLMELGTFDPDTRLEVDSDNRAIIAYASPADHFTIQSVIEKLDGSARSVEVIPLRRLPADEVARTIEYLMIGEKKDSSQKSRYPDYYGYGYSSRRSKSEESTDGFRIDADVESNRLLVRANEGELEEVLSILTKLGEMPSPASGSGTQRMLDVVPAEDAKQFFEQLQRNWNAISPNPLVLPEVVPSNETDSSELNAPADSEHSASDENESASPADESTRPADPAVAVPGARTASAPYEGQLFRTAVYQPARLPGHRPDSTGIESSSPSSAAATGAPPVVISLAPDGRLVITSKDPRALDRMEDLIRKLAPPMKEYEVFHLEYASATWVKLNLEDFFEDEEESTDKRRNRMFGIIYGYPYGSSGSGDDQRGLARRRQLRFIDDIDTNTIVVQGAGPSELKTISDLIKLYDIPEPVNVQKARVTKLIPVLYSDATLIAETIKDTFRDLLSANDKALQQQNGAKQSPRRPESSSFMQAFGIGGDSEGGDRTSVTFKGKLSIGVDGVTNTLVVSTEGDRLMEIVESMIESLDQAARPVAEVRVLKLKNGVDAARLQTALDNVLGSSGKKPSKSSKSAAPSASSKSVSTSSKPDSSRASPSRTQKAVLSKR